MDDASADAWAWPRSERGPSADATLPEEPDPPLVSDPHLYRDTAALRLKPRGYTPVVRRTSRLNGA